MGWLNPSSALVVVVITVSAPPFLDNKASWFTHYVGGSTSTLFFGIRSPTSGFAAKVFQLQTHERSTQIRNASETVPEQMGQLSCFPLANHCVPRLQM